MSSNFAQAQAEGLCLRYPENLGLHPQVNPDAAVNMLLRAISMAQTIPFTWTWIDKPQDGQVFLLYLSQPTHFPNDGIRWQESETKIIIGSGGLRELEIHEVKSGFVPGSGDTTASRLRRRYRLIKGGHPQLNLVHYSRGNPTPIVPSLMNTPVRMYPLRHVNEPSMYVAGEKLGQKVYPPGSGPTGAMPPGAMPGMPMNFQQQQAMLAHQNNSMEMLERRRERERAEARARAGSNAARPPRIDDEDSGDENDSISTRTLAMTRYKRNHDLMNEVFTHAAFGDKHKTPPKSPYSIFDKSELEEKAAKLVAEIEEMKARAAARKSGRSPTFDVSAAPDVSMQGVAS